MKFDGKAFAKELEEKLAERVGELGKKLRAVSMVVGDHPTSGTSEWHGDPASIKYSELKKAAAERVGIDFLVEKIEGNRSQELEKRIGEFGSRRDVDGVMVQLPVPGLQGQALKEVLSAIPLTKDMDGLRWEESGVTPATVRAILSILERIEKIRKQELGISDGGEKFVVVGARGAVGRPLVSKLKERGVEVIGLDLGDELGKVREGQVVISCTGKAGLITPELVQEGAVVIDVGAPDPDMTEEVYAKASVYVPSPGGVGPVTIVSLLENLCDII